MKMIKFVTYVICFSFMFSLVTAETGCFLFEDSDAYCQTIDREEADFECSLFGCDVEEKFFAEKDCSNLLEFPHCKKVLCKSSCQEDFLGKCSAGEIPAGGETEWCSPGCCKFSFFGSEFCGFEENKWLSEIQRHM